METTLVQRFIADVSICPTLIHCLALEVNDPGVQTQYDGPTDTNVKFQDLMRANVIKKKCCNSPITRIITMKRYLISR